MTIDPALSARLEFLCRVVARECDYLAETDRRLFAIPLTADLLARLPETPELSERVEAFAARFGRLQDTLGDKLLPALMQALGERPVAAADNLARAERFGFIDSAERWFGFRQLRNQMVHEYIEQIAVLAAALMAAHQGVPELIAAAERLMAEAARRIGG
jgi:hypothetical protein